MTTAVCNSLRGPLFFCFSLGRRASKITAFYCRTGARTAIFSRPEGRQELDTSLYYTHTHTHTQTQYYMTGTFTRPSGRQGSCDKVLVRPFSQDTRCSKQVREKLQALDRVIAAHLPSLLRLPVKKTEK